MDTIKGLSNDTLAANVDFFNKKIGRSNAANNLGKDDFLRILVTQLQNQDPTAPLEDKEFVAQMAQFSTLEQMTNMSKGFQKLMQEVEYSKMLAVLGKRVQLQSNDNHVVEGVVAALKNGVAPQVEVNGSFYDFSNIIKIQEATTP